MATRIAAANGNFTTGSTWQTSDATAQQIAGTTSQTVTTSYVASSTFTPGAIQIDGIAIFVNVNNATGTISVALDQGGSTVTGTEVTINCADIPTDGLTNGLCWVLFQFAPVTLAAATAYSVKIKTSGSNVVSCFRDGTSNNWDRMLRTTSTGAPAAADILYILGEKTGAGAQTTRTVTMDDAAAGATVYGAITVSAGGTMTYGTTASTNYYLKLAGDFTVQAGGTLNIGTVGTAIPSTSTAVLEFNITGSNGQYGLIIRGGGTFVAQGNALTTHKAQLTANAAGGATSLTTDVSTGWKNGDEIVIANTGASNTEKKSLTADASGTTLTITALAGAHLGTAPKQAHLMNMTRNVKVRGITRGTAQAYLLVKNGAVIDWDWVEFKNLGAQVTEKRGITVQCGTSNSAANINGITCDFGDSVTSLRIEPATTLNCAIVVSNFCGYNGYQHLLWVQDTVIGSGSVTITDVLCMVTGDTNASGAPFRCEVAEAIVDGVVVVNGGVSGSANLAIVGGGGVFGTFKNLTSYRNNSDGIRIENGLANKDTVFENFVAWGNNHAGVKFNDNTNGQLVGCIFGGTNSSFENGTGTNSGDINIAGGLIWQCVWRNWTLQTSETGIIINNPTAIACRIENSTSSGHGGADIGFAAGAGGFFDIAFINVQLSSTTKIGTVPPNWGKPYNRLTFQRWLQTTNSHRAYYSEGLIQTETTAGLYDVSPAVRMTPVSATRKLQFTVRKKKVSSGNSATISVKVRCSVSGDGAAYNGARPRLIQKANPGAGSTADVVLDTATASSDGAFETLTGTTAAVSEDCVLTFIVDCDGTAGWVNVDTVTIT